MEGGAGWADSWGEGSEGGGRITLAFNPVVEGFSCYVGVFVLLYG